MQREMPSPSPLLWPLGPYRGIFVNHKGRDCSSRPKNSGACDPRGSRGLWHASFWASTCPIIHNYRILLIIKKKKRNEKYMPSDRLPAPVFHQRLRHRYRYKQSSAPFKERHRFQGTMSKEGATHMVLWWGFVLRDQRDGNGQLDKVWKGKWTLPLKPLSPLDSRLVLLCLTRSIDQACIFGGWAQP